MNSISRRQLASGAIATTALFAVRSGRAAVSSAPSKAIDPIALVDPDLRPELLKIQPEIDTEIYSIRTLAALRKGAESWAQPPGIAPPVRRQAIPGAKGAPDVTIHIIGERSAAPRPAILYIHGGGYVLGRAVDGIVPGQQMAMRHDCLVISVDYRLAPETRFPGSLDDNYAALRWLYDHADALGVDRTRIAVLGESAGGGHAAMLAIAARDRAEIPICAQILIYPMLDDRTGSTRQPAPWIGTYIWNRAANRFGWSSLLGMPAGSARVPAGAVPARVNDLSGLPPAFIGVGSIDLFVDEDVDYARRLVDAGVPTELLVIDGGYHGFDVIVPAAPASLRLIQARDAAIGRGFARRHA